MNHHFFNFIRVTQNTIDTLDKKSLQAIHYNNHQWYVAEITKDPDFYYSSAMHDIQNSIAAEVTSR